MIIKLDFLWKTMPGGTQERNKMRCIKLCDLSKTIVWNLVFSVVVSYRRGVRRGCGNISYTSPSNNEAGKEK